MDCLEAQSIISQALDRSPVESTMLEAAKSHCRSCPECASFVKAMDAVKRAPLPAPSPDLADRIMSAVRAEASTIAVAASESSVPPAMIPRASTAPRRRLSRQQRLAWSSAAAVLLVVVGVGSALAVMRLMRPSGATVATEQRVLSDSAPAAVSPPQQEMTDGANGTYGGNAASADKGVPAPAATVYVTFNGTAYKLAGPATVTTAALNNPGLTRMSFDPTVPPAERQVYTSDPSRQIYIAGDDGTLQQFSAVRRTYRKQTYVLRSSPVESSGAWPTLPDTLAQPSSADGAPTFSLDGVEASGVSVYHKVGATSDTGIAVGPGTPLTDPAAGNPNWTWWEPIQ